MNTAKKAGSMTIHKAHQRDNFCTLPNALLQDKTLSFRARGILAMMLSMPAQWQTYHSWITEQGSEGEEAVRTAIRELEAAGYLTRSQKREAGRVKGFQWDWYSHPVPVSQRTSFRLTKAQKTSSGFSSLGKPGTIKDPVQKVLISQKTESKEAKETPPLSEESVHNFPSVWKPSSLTKEQKLKRIRPPAEFPSQDEFENFLSENYLAGVGDYRPDLYLELCQNKWHHWLERHNKWQPIRDWRAYVRGLEDSILNAYPA